jgi:hypothetical protein
LGELRQLPRDEPQADHQTGLPERADPTHPGRRVGFIVAATMATLALLIAGFCSIRWATIRVPVNTETHIAQYAESYRQATPAELIRDFEAMEKRGLEMPIAYNYKQAETAKRRWGLNAALAGIVTAIGILAALAMAVPRRHATDG